MLFQNICSDAPRGENSSQNEKKYSLCPNDVKNLKELYNLVDP